jgi:hypothetical protein
MDLALQTRTPRYVIRDNAFKSVKSHEIRSLRITPFAPGPSPQSAWSPVSAALNSFSSAGKICWNRSVANCSSVGLGAASAIGCSEHPYQSAIYDERFIWKAGFPPGREPVGSLHIPSFPNPICSPGRYRLVCSDRCQNRSVQDSAKAFDCRVFEPAQIRGLHQTRGFRVKELLERYSQPSGNLYTFRRQRLGGNH